MKKKCTAHIECGKDGFYSVYSEEDFPFGFFGPLAALPRALGPQEVPVQPASFLPELLLTSPIPSLPGDLEGS